MGVRGLTTYIAKNSDKYLHPHQLHDSYLVIDGNNLAAQLYKWHAKCYDCFGGDYDVYSKVITDFFDVLKKCNITPIVIFDGSYEDKKLRTIYGRVKSRYESAKKCNAYTEGSVQMFPLFLRELFTETVKKLGVRAMRCDFEADYEMACIAKTLNCPILSYDSDFFIFDVLYIPFSTMSIHAKRYKKKSGNIYVVECKLYRIENFLDSLGGMDKSNLPLLAVLLGNDYIKISVFSNFYKQLKLVTKKSMQSDQHRRIETVIKWLRKETYETAAKKVLGRVKTAKRKKIAEQIKLVADGYICTKSKLLPYLGVTMEHTQLPEHQESMAIDVEAIEEERTGDSSSEDGECDSIASDISVDIEEPVSPEVDTLNDHFPQWFLLEYRSCHFPAWFVDIAVHNRYFCVPQIDNFDYNHSHDISIKLLAPLHKLLTSGKKKYFIYIARFENTRIRNNKLETATMDLPTLEEIEALDLETRRATLLKILSFGETNTTAVLSKFPEDWHVFVLSIMYWVKNSEVKISNNHVYALIMCAILIKFVDEKLGYCRTLKLAQKFERDMHDEPGVEDGDDRGISKRDCLNYLKEMIPYFYMDEKMCRNPRIYDVYTIDAFARFQSCLFHIKYLSKVLNKPYQDVLVSDFYNGTFIYGVFTNLNKRTDALAYLNNLLSDSKGILSYFTAISSAVTDNLNTVAISTGRKRRKTKNRNKSKESTSSEEKKVICMDDDDEESVMDVNNQYSILNFV